MTKREQTTQKVNEYNAYAKTVDVHQKPQIGLNSGAHGRDFETRAKLAIGNYRFDGVAKAGRHDSTKKINGKITSIEFKSGAGELATLDEFGNYTHSILDSDLIVYAPEYSPDYDVIKQAYVLTTVAFMDIMDELKLARYKKSSAMLKRESEYQYYDRLTIQTFSTSRKKTDALYNALEESAVTLAEFIESLNQ